MRNGLYWLLVNLAETVPVLVDDAQWVDAPSLQFLGFLARRVDSVAVSVIIATRTGEHHRSRLPGPMPLATDHPAFSGLSGVIRPRLPR